MARKQIQEKTRSLFFAQEKMIPSTRYQGRCNIEGGRIKGSGRFSTAAAEVIRKQREKTSLSPGLIREIGKPQPATAGAEPATGSSTSEIAAEVKETSNASFRLSG